MLERDGTGEERERDFDREKVGALDREASRKGGTIGSSPCRLDSRREREREILAGSRLGVFRASLPASPPRLESNTVLYLLPLYRTENLINGLLSCIPHARGKLQHPIFFGSGRNICTFVT